MSCCGGSSRPQHVRPQVTKSLRMPSNQVAPLIARPPVVVKMRKLTVGKCPICNIPLSTVNMAGRSRTKCANPNCEYTEES